MSDAAHVALDGLLTSLGLSRSDTGGTLEFAGCDPIAATRHHYGAASAAAIAAEAVGVATYWTMRGGSGQDLKIDLRRAVVPGLRTSSHISQNGHELPYNRAPSEIANFFPTKDNRRIYVLRTAAYASNLIGVLDLLRCENSSEGLSRAIAGWDAQDLEDRLAERKLIGAYARTCAEWRAHPQGQYLSGLSPISITKIGDSAPELPTDGDRPLSGIRVLDMAHVLAGPTCARVLAEQGADVLHTSAPLMPDDFRVAMDTCMGKRAAFIDLNREGDIDAAKGLIRSGDVLIQSFRPGALDRRGLSPMAVAELRPGIVYVSVSAYGGGGPWADRGGYEPVGQTVTGLAIAEGSAELPLLCPTFTLNDYLAAYLASAGAMGALVRRAREGGSYHVEVSLARCSMWLQDLGLLPTHLWPTRGEGELPFPAPLDDDFIETDCAFGRIRHARPLVDFSQTPARWDSGSEPLGASLPFWR